MHRTRRGIEGPRPYQPPPRHRCTYELLFGYAGPYRPRPAYRFSVENSVYVAPGMEGRGVGRALLVELIARCTALGLRQMIAVIGDSGHLPSIEFHKSLGFTQIGTLRAVGFKFGRWVDSVILQRALGSGGETLPMLGNGDEKKNGPRDIGRPGV